MSFFVFLCMRVDLLRVVQIYLDHGTRWNLLVRIIVVFFDLMFDEGVLFCRLCCIVDYSGGAILRGLVESTRS